MLIFKAYGIICNMIDCIIQARMGSTRLPGKVLMLLDKKYTVLDYVINQLKHSKLLGKIIIATTNLEEDDVIVDFAKKNEIQCFRGSSTDVLDRFYHCSKKFSLRHIMRITGDNPLIDPAVIDKAIKEYINSNVDYLTNSIQRTFPYGTEVEIFSFDSLELVWKFANKKSEREHVTPYFYNHPTKFKIHHFIQESNQSRFRYTIDRKEDYLVILEIISRIKKRPIQTVDIIKLFTEEPELAEINSNVISNEGYIKSINADKNLRQRNEKEN